MTMMSPVERTTRLLRELSQHKIAVWASEPGRLAIRAPKDAMTEAIRQELLACKVDLLCLYTVYPDEEIPPSLKGHVCCQCGGPDLRKLPGGGWVCPCYWTWDRREAQEALSTPQQESQVAA